MDTGDLPGEKPIPESAVSKLWPRQNGSGIVQVAGKRIHRSSGVHRERRIGFIEQHREKVLDERQMAYVVGRIEMKRLGRSTETDEYHVNYVRNKISQRG